MKCWVELYTALKTLGSKSTLFFWSLSSLCSLSSCQHMNSSTRPSSHSSISHSLVMLLVPLSVAATTITFPGRAATLSNTLSTISPLLPRGPAFASGKGRKDQMVLDATAIPWTTAERESVCGWLSMNHLWCPQSLQYPQEAHSSFSTVSDLMSSIILSLLWIETTW